MAWNTFSFDPDSVASNSDAASSAMVMAAAASDVASAASVAAAKGSDASSKIAAKSATWDKASAASSVAATKIANVSEDATPQLGGSLDCNGYEIQNVRLHIVADDAAKTALTATVGMFVFQTDASCVYVCTEGE